MPATFYQIGCHNSCVAVGTIRPSRRGKRGRRSAGSRDSQCATVPHCTHPLEEKLAFERLRNVCAACGFVHFRAPKVGVSVLVEEGDGFCWYGRAVEPGKGKWSLPSGLIEWDEPPRRRRFASVRRKQA